MKTMFKLTSAFLILAFVVALAPVSTAYAVTDVPPNYPCEIFHTVVSGDNLLKISQAYGTPAIVIVRMNNLTNPDLMYPGDVLCVKYWAVAGDFYAVRAGDNLTRIASTYMYEIEYLAAVNGITDPNYILAGQLLYIPPDIYFFQ